MIADRVKNRESRHSCESSPAFGGMDSRFRGNDENGSKRTFYESINDLNFLSLFQGKSFAFSI
jgi:hypothetical protein